MGTTGYYNFRVQFLTGFSPVPQSRCGIFEVVSMHIFPDNQLEWEREKNGKKFSFSVYWLIQDKWKEKNLDEDKWF